MSETKKNPDYSESAVNLCNPDTVSVMLYQRREMQARRAGLEAELAQLEVYEKLQEASEDIAKKE